MTKHKSSSPRLGDGGSQNLPLGLMGSGLLLAVFTGLKSSISLLLMAARNGQQDGFPFLFETILVFPFTMQVLFYTAQTCWQLRSTSRGFSAIRGAAPSMGPCCFYAGFITSTTLLETYSLQFILPSMFVVLKQLTMVVIATGEAVILAARPSSVAWSVITMQAVCVGLFQYSSSPAKSPPRVLGTPSHQRLDDGMNTAYALEVHRHEVAVLTIGVCACLLSVLTGGMGSILQQRFMQKQAKVVPISVKLLWQHAIELCLVLTLILVRSEDRERVRTYGFFGGWNKWACIVSVSMWFSFLSASAISAYVSALAGAMAVAVSVALTGALEFLMFGRAFSGAQFVLMMCVCFNAVLYTRERMASMSNGADEENRGKRSPIAQGYHSIVGKSEDNALLCLCEDGIPQQTTTKFGSTDHPSREAGAGPALEKATTSLRAGSATAAGVVEL